MFSRRPAGTTECLTPKFLRLVTICFPSDQCETIPLPFTETRYSETLHPEVDTEGELWAPE